MQIRFLFGAALSFIAAVVALGNPRLTVTGRVVDSTGNPLSHATVMVYHAGVKNGYSTFCPSCYEDCGKRTTTDSSGRYTITKLDGDLWFELLVVHDGYAPTFTRVEDLSKGQAPTSVLSLRTVITDPARKVIGRVIDAEGKVVRDAVVKSEGVETHKSSMIGAIPGLEPLAVTDHNGDFELVYAKRAKRVLVSVEARTFAPRFVVLLTASERQPIELSRGATIRGRLVKDGEPVGDAEIGLVARTRGGFGPRLTIVGTPYPEVRVGTQQDGTFAISDVPTQTEWYVYAKMESVGSRGSTEAKLCATTRPEEIVNVGDIPLRPGYSFGGRVVLTDGQSVPDGMRVIITSQRVWDSQTAILDKGGRFEFSGLSEGRYSIGPAVRGYSLSGGQYEVEISVEKNVNDFVISLNPK